MADAYQFIKLAESSAEHFKEHEFYKNHVSTSTLPAIKGQTIIKKVMAIRNCLSSSNSLDSVTLTRVSSPIEYIQSSPIKVSFQKPTEQTMRILNHSFGCKPSSNTKSFKQMNHNLVAQEDATKQPVKQEQSVLNEHVANLLATSTTNPTIERLEWMKEETEKPVQILNHNLANHSVKPFEAITSSQLLLTDYKSAELIKNDSYQRRKHQCHICSKRFVGKSNLMDHIRFHNNMKLYKCSYCDKSFVQSGSLISHLRTHTKERPYRCQYCTKSFAQTSSLKVHIRTHTNERNFLCDLCGKGFMSHGDRATHRRIHDDVKKFQCYVCKKGFAQKVNLQKHSRLIQCTV